MTHPSGLSIVMPAYNEAQSIQEVAASVVREVPAAIADFELILVNDGSSDRTGAIMDALAAADARIRVVHHAANLGKGAALRTAFQKASKEWVLFLDADGQIAFSELSAFLPFTRDHDIIIGYRTRRPDPWPRLFFSRVYGWIVAAVLGVRVQDVNCPFKLFRRSLLQLVPLHSEGFAIDAELLAAANSCSLRFKELPVISHPRKGGSSSVRLRHVYGTLRELVSLKAALSRRQYRLL